MIKMKLNKLLISMILLMAILPMVSAVTLGTFKQNDCVSLIQTCSNCTYVNVTSVTYPNSSLAISDVAMSKAETRYSYDYCNTSLLGTYVVTGIWDLDGVLDVWDYNFEVTYTGEKLSTGQINIYICALVFLLFLIVGLCLLIRTLPANDFEDEAGAIIQISNLKHLRRILWIGVWGLIMAIVFIMSNLSLAYLNYNMVGTFFFVLFKIMFYVTIIGVPIWFILIIYNIWRDKQFQDMINRGVDMKEYRI